MLKFTYTESGIYLESVRQSLEEVIAARTLLAARMRGRLVTERGTASFLLPANLSLLERLTAIAQLEENLTPPYPVDTDFVEISLHGLWLSSRADCTEGLFLAELGAYAEWLLLEIWRLCFSSPANIAGLINHY